MTATPKELLAAAGVLACEARGHSGSPNEEMRLASKWIAATVRADDDEPVTDDRLEKLVPIQLGHGYRLTKDLSIWNSSKGFGIYYTGGKGDTKAKRLFTIRTMLDLRTLCRAMGITLPEVPA